MGSNGLTGFGVMIRRAAIPAFGLLVWLPSVAGAGEPDPLEILRKADAATKSVKAVSYEAEYYGVGDLAQRYGRIRGSFQGRRGDRGFWGQLFGGASRGNLMHIKGVRISSNSDTAYPFDVATDGKQIVSIEEKGKLFVHGRLPAAGSLLQPAGQLFMLEYLHPTPFNDEITGKVARHEGIKDIGGVECDVIFIVYRNNSESRWYFGREDSLPRRVDRISKRRGAEGAVVLSISKLDVKPDFDVYTFRPECPEGYEKRAYDEPGKMLAVGRQAPDWVLKTSDGKEVRLSDLRGNVVVMDFWATWCRPCKMAMPGVQMVHEKFEGRPVKVFGVAVWEKKGAEPGAYMKSKDFTYTLLLNGDKVADDYRVSGIPSFYVIDPQGRVVYAASGFLPNREKELVGTIERILKGSNDED